MSKSAHRTAVALADVKAFYEALLLHPRLAMKNEDLQLVKRAMQTGVRLGLHRTLHFDDGEVTVRIRDKTYVHTFHAGDVT